MSRSDRVWRKRLTLALLIFVIPVVVVGGAYLFEEKYYAWVSLAVAVLSCLPVFYCFEKKETTAKELIILAVMSYAFRGRPLCFLCGAGIQTGYGDHRHRCRLFATGEPVFWSALCRRWFPTFTLAKAPGPPSKCLPGDFLGFLPGYWRDR